MRLGGNWDCQMTEKGEGVRQEGAVEKENKNQRGCRLVYHLKATGLVLLLHEGDDNNKHFRFHRIQETHQPVVWGVGGTSPEGRPTLY